MFTKKDITAFITKLKNNPRISDIGIDPEYGKHHRFDSMWYDDEILCFTIDNRFRYSCCVYGDVRLTHTPTEDDVVSKGSHADDVREFLEEHNITTDKKLYDAIDKGIIYVGNNNWFEDVIYDTKKEQYFDYCLDVADDPFVDINYLDELINQYKKEEGETK